MKLKTVDWSFKMKRKKNQSCFNPLDDSFKDFSITDRKCEYCLCKDECFLSNYVYNCSNFPNGPPFKEEQITTVHMYEVFENLNLKKL